MRVYGMGHPTRATRAVWALEEVGAEYEYRAVHPHDPEYRAIHPLGRVPALVDGDLVLTESGAICAWIADRFPEAGLIPEPRTRARADHDRWCLFVLTELEQPLWTLAKHKFALPAEIRCREVHPAAHWEWARAAEVLSAALGDGMHLVGDRFTVADLLATHTLFWATHAKAELAQDNLRRYLAEHQARPAFARALARETR